MKYIRQILLFLLLSISLLHGLLHSIPFRYRLNHQHGKHRVAVVEKTFGSFQLKSRHLVLSSSSASTDQSEAKNWIERSDPLGAGTFFSTANDDSSAESIAYFSLGIDGSSFELGNLSRKFNAVMLKQAMTRFAETTGEIPVSLLPIYATFAMDLSAKEATRAALNQNGMDFVDEGENELWGEVENIQVGGLTFDTFQDAVDSGSWSPGQDFSFVVRNVKAYVPSENNSNFLSEPLLEEEEGLKVLGNSKIESLEALAKDTIDRCNKAPIDVSLKGNVPWKAPEVMIRSDLSISARNKDGSENEQIAFDLLNSLKDHGYVIVDVGAELSDGKSTTIEKRLAGMWQATEHFFKHSIEAEVDDSIEFALPSMQNVPGAGSRHAVYGYQSFDEGSMRFLETRLQRKSKVLLPTELGEVLASEEMSDLVHSFYNLADIGRDITRIATATISDKKNLFFEQDKNKMPEISGLSLDEMVGFNNEANIFTKSSVKSASSALRLVEELVDDGRICEDFPMDESPVSMSPHRMCCYTGQKRSDGLDAREVFGAHTDTSFVTLVPVASVSGLEVFDESISEWVRPELIAKRHFEEEVEGSGTDSNILNGDVPSKGESSRRTEPWHARYVVVMPGELLQIVTQNEVKAAVHRVVAATEGESRISAPVLLRARTRAKMDVSRYYGVFDKDDPDDGVGKLLQSCDGMNMYDIHNSLQPST